MIGQPRVDRAAGAQHGALGLRRDRSSLQARARNRIRSAGAPTRITPRSGSPIISAGMRPDLPAVLIDPGSALGEGSFRGLHLGSRRAESGDAPVRDLDVDPRETLPASANSPSSRQSGTRASVIRSLCILRQASSRA
jgi:hypothetical protein